MLLNHLAKRADVGNSVLMTSPSDDLDQARYAAMRWNTPLSVDHSALLLDRLDVRSGMEVLDLVAVGVNC